MSEMVAVETSFNVECTDDESIHESAERVMVELVELSEAGVILDGSVAANGAACAVTISVTVSAEDLGAGVNLAITAMRNAIHSAGNATPVWPSHGDWMAMVAQNMFAELIPGSAENGAEDAVGSPVTTSTGGPGV